MQDVDAYGTSRVSRLFPNGERLAHADLHNHTRLSDGDGAPERAFASMRSAGLDAAALTDHAVFASALGRFTATPFNALTGIDTVSWRQLRRLAEAAHEDGEFVAWRGFEWSDPVRGHVNVWGTHDYADPLRHLGLGLGPLYDWLVSPAGRDGLASFNHPGGRFDAFVLGGFGLRPSVRRQLVALEVFNKTHDYIFRLSGKGARSPLCRCLDAGWRPGLTGVTDEHGEDWGRVVGKGRTGLWVCDLTTDGVREALLGRRSFATREWGLRLDASLQGVRMGGVVPVEGGAAGGTGGDGVLRLDVQVSGRRALQVQLLGTGPQLPTRLLTADVGEADAVVEIPVPAHVLDPARHAWLVLRLADMGAGMRSGTGTASEPGAPPGWGRSVAYASPWWLEATAPLS